MIIDVNAWIGTWPFRSLRDNTPESLVACIDRCGIDRAIVSPLEAVFHRDPRPANEMLVEQIAAFRDRLIPMATLNPAMPGWETDLADWQERLGMKGVRLFPVYHDYAVDGPEAKKLASACSERGMPVLIPQRLEDVRQHHWIDPGKEVPLNGIAALLDAVPGVTVVVPNARGIIDSDLWKRENLRNRRWYVDTSLTEFLYGLHYDISRKNPMGGFFEGGGASHLMFGSHQPMSYAASALVKLATLPVDSGERDRIASGNAVDVFDL